MRSTAHRLRWNIGSSCHRIRARVPAALPTGWAQAGDTVVQVSACSLWAAQPATQGDNVRIPQGPARTRTILAASALVLAGFGGGAVLAATGTANAATGSSSSSTTNGHGGETPLTGTTATKVKAAALAKYPGANIDRVETDSDGVYEAHITTKAGDDVTVQVNKAFAVTGTQTGGGHGRHDGDDGGTNSSSSAN